MNERDGDSTDLEGWLSAELVHEMKTPLAVMHGYARTLLERDLPEEQRRWFLEVIARQSRELSGALDRLDELRRLHEAPATGTTDIGDALVAAAARIRQERPGVRVSMASGDGAGTAVAGPHHWVTRGIGEALIAAAADGEEVRVHVRAGPSVELTIDGPAAPRPHALSLYSARRISERFGGELSVSGSTITMRFPRSA